MTNKDTDLCPEPIVKLVTKHLRTTYRLPISPLMQAVIRPVLERLQHEQAEGRSLLLDAGCGTGESTLTIAQRFSDRFVLGVDRSLARLRKTPPLPANALVVRARLEEFWLMAHNAGIVFEKTFLLYPNPYPKRWQIGRRWYGHPIFPIILATTQAIELRTNQRWYAEDFCRALQLSSWRFCCEQLCGEDAISSPFERKYCRRGDTCWIVCAWPSVCD